MSIVAFGHPSGISENSFTTVPIAVGGTTLTVRNTSGLIANDFIVIGKPGFEQTEALKITTTDSDTQFTIPATKFAHPIDTLVSFTPFNQIRFASATTKTGAKTQQGAAVDIEWDEAGVITEVNLTSVTSGFSEALRLELPMSRDYQYNLGEKRYLLRVEEDSKLKYAAILSRSDIFHSFESIIEEAEAQIERASFDILKENKEVTLNRSARKYSLVFLDVYTK